MSDYHQFLRDRIEKHLKRSKELGRLEDGYYYFFPKGYGAMSAHELRILADILDEHNKEWDEQVKDYFGGTEEADRGGAGVREEPVQP